MKINSEEYEPRVSPFLPPRKKEKPVKEIQTGFEMTFNYEKKFTEPALTINDTPLMHIGEAVVIVGLPGSGKSQTIQAAAAGFIARRLGITIDSLGIKDHTDINKMALIIDMERPHDQCKDSYDGIFKSLGHNLEAVTLENKFKYLAYKCWVDFVGVKERMEAFEILVSSKEYALVFADGILGFIEDFNDNKECSAKIAWMLGLANKYGFALVITMHPNKGTDTMAGHIGGFLYRYARACLLIRRNTYDKEVREITSDFAQGKVSYGGNICSMFRYSQEHGMFVTEENEPAAKPKEKYSTQLIKIIFNEYLISGKTEVPTSELRKKYAIAMGIKEETAKKHIQQASDEDGILIPIGQGKGTCYKLRETE